MTKGREEFLSLLSNARDVQFIVAEDEAERGGRVRVMPFTVCPSYAARLSHTDDGDLEVTKRLEVKHWPNIDFRSLTDVPYKNIIIDEVYKVDKPHELPLDEYRIVNASMTACLIVGHWTRRYWFKQDRYDKRDQCKHCFYFVPKEHVEFRVLMRRVQAEQVA